MSVNTSCESCIFAHPISEKIQCDCGIIDAISYNKEIINKNGFNYINNYMCRLAFSKDTYQKNLDTLANVDIRSELSKRCQIRYYLVVELTSTDGTDIAKACDKINSSSINPMMVSFIVSKSENINDTVDIIKTCINSNIQWKVHNFLNNETIAFKIVNIFDTNKRWNNTHYLMFIKDTSLINLNTNIITINEYINIQQQKYDILVRENNNLDGLFMTFDKYDTIKFHRGSDLEEWFTQIENFETIIYTYDV
jgi:hypothetical protein